MYSKELPARPSLEQFEEPTLGLVATSVHPEMEAGFSWACEVGRE